MQSEFKRMGEMVEAVLHQHPMERKEDLILIDLTDHDYPCRPAKQVDEEIRARWIWISQRSSQ